MAKDNGAKAAGNKPSVSGYRRANERSTPYDPNNSFVRKVATKVTDLIPQNSWLSKLFNSSQDESDIQANDSRTPEYENYEDKQTQPPPLKRPCIRMDIVHPPGTFSIKNASKQADKTNEKQLKFTNPNAVMHDFSESSAIGNRFHSFVSSTPAFPMNSKTHKIPDTRPTLNLLMSENNNNINNNNGASNGTDNNSESSESTSGCSSLIPQTNKPEAPTNPNFSSSFTDRRRYVDEKLSFTNHLQSPKSLFFDSSTRETLSSRRPSFNPAIVTNNSFERSNSLASPFYSGNTMFGGANAANLYRRSNSVLSETSQHLQVPKRTSVQVNPSVEKSTSDISGLSQTARKILETLDQFSSPLSDARKMPTVRNVMNSSSVSSPLLGSSRKRAREDETGTPKTGFRHLTRELTVPTVPDILRIKRKQRLQNSTANARKIMNSRSNTGLLPSTSREYNLRIDADEKEKPTTRNYLKAKKKHLDEEETIETVNLPNIPLPISSLPRFDIAVPKQQNVTPRTPPQNNKNESFEFASPIKFNESVRSVESINDKVSYTFSKPLTDINEKTIPSAAMNVEATVSTKTSKSFQNFEWSGPTTSVSPMLIQKEPTNSSKESPSAPKVASQLKKGSIMDYFAQETIVIDDDSEKDKWECNKCWIENSGKRCIACKKSKDSDSSSDIEIIEVSDEEDTKTAPPKEKKSDPPSKSVSKPLPSFTTFTHTQLPMAEKSSLFNTVSKDCAAPFTPSSTVSRKETLMATPPVSKVTKLRWNCPCCMVQNEETAMTCPCCNTVKPGSLNVSPKCDTPRPTASVKSGFGDMFKKPTNTWSCETCMIHNKSELTKCAACETAKPGTEKAKPNTEITVTSSSSSGFGNMFKKVEGSWTCDTCLIQNKSDVSKCAACETPKPGSAPVKSSLKRKSDSTANTSVFKFGIDKAADAPLPKPNGFNFPTSTNVDPSLKTGFTFGIPASKDSETAKFQFGAETSKEDTESAKVNFSFDASSKMEKNTAPSGFVFGVNKNTEQEKKEEEKSIGEVKSVSGGFTFGAPTSTTSHVTSDAKLDQKETTTQQKELESSTAKPTVNFIFNAPKPSTDIVKDNLIKTDPVKTTEESKISKTSFGITESTDSPKSGVSSFSFSSTTDTGSASSNVSSPFSFATPSTKPGELPTLNTSKPSFSFGKSSEPITPSASENKAPMINFNSGSTVTSSSPSPSFDNQINQTTSSVFGSATVPAQTIENKPSLLFGGPEKKSLTTFGSDSNEKSNKITSFGTPNTDKPISVGFSSTFGSTPSTPSLFGNGSPATSAPAVTPSFGAVNSTTSMFGGVAKPSVPSSTPTTGIFTFGQSSQQQIPATPTFNFSAGSNATHTPIPASVTDQKGIFSFGASSGGPVGNGFGTPNTASSFGSNTSTSGFTFNAPPKTECFGQASAPVFNTPSNTAFPGASPAPLSSGFNFGSTNIPSSFNFSSTPSPSTGGFSFNAPSTPSTGGTPVSFDPNASPSFNFTAGTGGAPVAFNAQPTRKIKKAVRRMPRQ